MKTWYDEDRADEAALALLWITAAEDAEHLREGFARDIVRRLRERRLVTGAEPGLVFTDLGRSRAKAAFNRLFGKPNPASIAPPIETHLVDEVDGD